MGDTSLGVDQLARIRRVPRVRGRSIVLRDVTVDDAPFILSLRLDPKRNQFLSPVADDVGRQQAWIRNYLQSEGQAYFVISSLTGEALGVVRLYDAEGDSFSWGSWIMKEGAPVAAAMEAALLVCRLGLDWGFQAAHFKVHQANVSVLKFHEMFGARRVAQVGNEVQLHIGRDAIEAALQRFSRFLPPRATS